MDEENLTTIGGNNEEDALPREQKNPRFWPIFSFFGGILATVLIIYFLGIIELPEQSAAPTDNARKLTASLEEVVLPPAGAELPIVWGDLGKRMIETGVIDAQKFENLYARRGGLNPEEKMLLYGINNGKLKINAQNSGLLLNLLWAFGLNNKNQILETGPMSDPRYGGAGNFASTGGWSLAVGNTMDYYSRHQLIVLSSDQQAVVESVAKNIYRPCCNNPTYFPDCNHGMAMFGLLELMASQGVSEEQMYRTALIVNSYWFPDTYLTIAKYLETKGYSWNALDLEQIKQVLGFNMSSASGYQQILSQVTQPERRQGGSCGV